MKKEHIQQFYNAEEIAANKNLKPTERIKQLVRACHLYQERLTELETMPQAIDAELRKHQTKQGVLQGSNELERLKATLRRYQDTASLALSGAESFRDEMLIWLRAMVICIETAGNAGTHSEKNARLRGAIEILERTISKLGKEKFDLSRLYWRWSDSFDSFRSDYPVRDLLQSNRELQQQLDDAQKTIASLKGEPVENTKEQEPEF